MAGKGNGAAERMSNQIGSLKYVALFSNVFVIMLALAIFALCVWLSADPDLGEWVRDLELEKFYIGVWLLILTSFIMIVASAVGCLSIFSETKLFLMIFVGTQIFCFVAGLIGAAVMLEYSTQHSQIQPMIRESLRRLIMNAQHAPSRRVLSIIQENIGCCGADGPGDYTNLHQPLPSQCRDTVTGNPFFHGCVDELTWFFEEKTIWIATLAMVLCFLHILNVVMSVILSKGFELEILLYEEEEARLAKQSKNETSPAELSPKDHTN